MDYDGEVLPPLHRESHHAERPTFAKLALDDADIRVESSKCTDTVSHDVFEARDAGKLAQEPASSRDADAHRERGSVCNQRSGGRVVCLRSGCS